MDLHTPVVVTPSPVDTNPLEIELVSLLADQANRTMALAAPMFPLILIPLFAKYVGWAYPIVWGSLMVVGCTGYARFVARLAKDPTMPARRKLVLVRWAFAASAATIAAMQLFIPFLPPSMCLLITIFVAGCTTSFIITTAGHGPTFIPAMLIFMVPCSVIYAVTPSIGMTSSERLALIGIFIVYALAMIGYARGVYSVFVSSFQIRLQRDELTTRLSAALQDAEAANRAKTRFLASASHDLRQPMHALSIFSGSLLMRPLDTRSDAIAAQIDKAVRVLTAQLDGLLDVSRLDAGVVEPAPEPIDLSAWLHQIADEFASQAERKGLSLVRQIEDGLYGETDPVLARRVVANLLSNAVKYTGAGSVLLSAVRDGDQVRIGISDSGPGIAREERERVFEEFYQIHNPERDRTQGLGLGLSIVRRLSDLLGLGVTMTSVEGEGTRFTLDIRATRDARARPGIAAMTDSLPSIPSCRILVVDDEEAVRIGMRTLLEEMGFEVALASSTEAAIETASDFQPELVLADFRLRGDDTGIRTIQALQAIDPSVSGLLVSGDTAPERLREAHAAGIALLHKPVQPSLLRESVGRMIAARRERDPR